MQVLRTFVVSIRRHTSLTAEPVQRNRRRISRSFYSHPPRDMLRRGRNASAFYPLQTDTVYHRFFRHARNILCSPARIAHMIAAAAVENLPYDLFVQPEPAL